MARGRVKTEQHHVRIRAFLGAEAVVDHTTPLLVWEIPYYPTYYFPKDAFAPGVLEETTETVRTPSRGEATVYNIKAGGAFAEKAARAGMVTQDTAWEGDTFVEQSDKLVSND